MAGKDKVVILSAVRTPIGSFCGALSSLRAHDLGAVVIKEAVARARVQPSDVSEVIMGQALTAGQGQNPARQASMKAGLPKEVTATGLNMLCGSGLKAISLGAALIADGQAKIVVCGGQESMSQAPHCHRLRLGGPKVLGDTKFIDTMLNDGLTDVFHDAHMGMTAEEVASKWGITREEQDALALESQKRVAATTGSGGKGFSAEIVPVEVPGPKRGQTTIVDKDEYPRPDTTMEDLVKLKPVFKKDGTVTAGNASGINDGAAAVVLTTEEYALSKNLPVMATIVSYAQSGVEPMVMGMGPVPAVKKALEKANWSVDDVDLFELNEAFASQSIACVRDLGIDSSKVNVRGGAIALGHPIGASGARVLVTLIHALQQEKKKRGVASLCVGGGMGVAMCIECNTAE
ncbi:acetyl-CoA acetyltransferase [Ischnura elegans]|uniref:acetyl-CoA acetyltransferase n=1 Tax=Ischnura elegans TaxID=197161 RepID=UPI001ED86FF3|nr:acetyl-CoA acetyltransferase [Ischnura elegans]